MTTPSPPSSVATRYVKFSAGPMRYWSRSTGRRAGRRILRWRRGSAGEERDAVPTTGHGVDDHPALGSLRVPVREIDELQGTDPDIVRSRGDPTGLDDEGALVLLGVVDVDGVVAPDRLERDPGGLGGRDLGRDELMRGVQVAHQLPVPIVPDLGVARDPVDGDRPVQDLRPFPVRRGGTDAVRSDIVRDESEREPGTLGADEQLRFGPTDAGANDAGPFGKDRERSLEGRPAF